MTKKDLMTGDIIVTRSGYLGVILKDEDMVLYQTIGADMLFEFNDDLTYDDEDYRDGDIMQVYRGNTFWDVDNDEDAPFYQRDYNWHRPTAEEREAREKALEEERQKKLAEMREAEQQNKNDRIFVIAQCFYGNRTGVQVERKGIDSFLLGYTSAVDLSQTGEKVERKIVRAPDTDNVVIVYDQIQEDEYVNVKFPEQYAEHAEKYKERTGRDFTMQVTCKIPEIDFEIHTRCFACRIDENGELKSLENGDDEKFIEYFPVR